MFNREKFDETIKNFVKTYCDHNFSSISKPLSYTNRVDNFFNFTEKYIRDYNEFNNDIFYNFLQITKTKESSFYILIKPKNTLKDLGNGKSIWKMDSFVTLVRYYERINKTSHYLLNEDMFKIIVYKILESENKLKCTYDHILQYLKTNKESDVLLDSTLHFMQYNNKNIIKRYQNRENANPLDCGLSFYTIPLKEEIVNYLMYWVSTQLMVNI